MGGGQDRDQALVARDLVETKREALAEAVAGGAAMLAVCGGYQLLGQLLRARRTASRCPASAWSTSRRCASPGRA